MTRPDPMTVVPTPHRVTDAGGTFVVPSILRWAGDDQGVTALRPFVRALEDSGALTRVATVDTHEGEWLRIIDTGAGDEGYEISIRSDGVSVSGGLQGLRHAAQTLLGLLPPGSLMPGSGEKAVLPCCDITDRPALAWRGVMIDTARHFMPMSWLRTVVEIAAFHKLNVLHLHLTDDQGWRMPIDAFPRLTEVGGQRRETLRGQAPGTDYDGIAHGGSYSKDELRALVAHADSHGITVVPEIDLPGHMVAALAAYPEWGNADEQLEVLTTWGISKDIINTRPHTIAALKVVLDEVMDVFPSHYIHLGGDEVPTRDWESSSEVAALMERNGLSSPRAVQGWIMDQLVRHVRANGRTVVAWDEAVDADISLDTVIQGWRSPEHVEQAISAGYRTIASPQQHYYFDYQYSLQPGEPQGIGLSRGAHIDLEKVLTYEVPDAAVGVEAPLWSEYVKTPQRASYQLLPRLAGLAEVAWRGGATTLEAFGTSARAQEKRYRALGWEHRPLTGPGPRWSSVLDPSVV